MHSRTSLIRGFLPLVALFAVSAPAFAGGGIPLATYRAVHDLVLDPSVDTGDISTITGRLVTEFKGSECAGYTTTTRFVTESVDGDGTRQVVDARSVSIEKPDGSFQFDNQTYEDGKLTESAKGTAMRNGGAVRVNIKDPEKKVITLDADVAFPNEQVIRSLEAARAGERFLDMKSYDGLDNGETVSPTTVILGAGSTDPSDVGDEAPIADAGFATMQHWPVTITYFDPEKGVDQAPDYSMSAILYDNGIMRRLRLDYGDFALLGTLVRLDVLPQPACP